MINLIKALELYLKENIDEQLELKTWQSKNSFPFFLRKYYNFYAMTILEVECILLEIIDETPSIDQLQKHINQIKSLSDQKIVLFYKEISRYRRKSLIKNRIPFVVENGQMYLPFLAIDLTSSNDYIKKEKQKFTTPGQVAYLHFLYHMDEVINATDFAIKFNLNKMTASRALNELYHLNLLTYKTGGMTGRSKEYKRIKDPDYFQRGRDYIKSPVRSIIHTKTRPLDAFTAGVDALAKLSTINPSPHPIVAIDKNKLNKEQVEIINNRDFIQDNKFIEVELWEYDPGLFSNNQCVDILSLHASLQEDLDERVEIALEEVLEGESWYTD